MLPEWKFEGQAEDGGIGGAIDVGACWRGRGQARPASSSPWFVGWTIFDEGFGFRICDTDFEAGRGAGEGMERRGRAVIDPKVRQVGFVTPGEGTDLINLAIPLEQGANSPSPVLIPPVRINDGASVAPAKAAPMPVPSPTSRRHPTVDVNLPLGSYNPADSVLGSSNTPSSGKAGSHGESVSMLGLFCVFVSLPCFGADQLCKVL